MRVVVRFAAGQRWKRRGGELTIAMSQVRKLPQREKIARIPKPMVASRNHMPAKYAANIHLETFL